MKKLYIARHGETDWNLQGRTQGIKDSELTELGLQQADLLAGRLIDENIEVIYSSCLSRAKSTASIISNRVNVPYFCNEDLNEINYGRWEGLTSQEIKGLYPNELKKWRNEPHNACIPEGEKLLAVQERIVNFFERLINNSFHANILVVSHSTIIKLLLLHILGMELCSYYRLKQQNCSLNIISFENYGPVLLKYNDQCHLK